MVNGKIGCTFDEHFVSFSGQHFLSLVNVHLITLLQLLASNSINQVNVDIYIVIMLIIHILFTH